MSKNLPNEEEFADLNRFPKLYFIVGNPHKPEDLLRAGLYKAKKIILFRIKSSETDSSNKNREGPKSSEGPENILKTGSSDSSTVFFSLM